MNQNKTHEIKTGDFVRYMVDDQKGMCNALGYVFSVNDKDIKVKLTSGSRKQNKGEKFLTDESRFFEYKNSSKPALNSRYMTPIQILPIDFGSFGLTQYVIYRINNNRYTIYHEYFNPQGRVISLVLKEDGERFRIDEWITNWLV